jgi:2-phospho-L-lactate guanylyltransferase (CobY/MobA/RfbA family)
VDTLLAGAHALEAGEARLLVATADIPFLTGVAVADFLERAREIGAGFAWPIVPAEACEAAFPGTRRTTLRLREGTFTGGNLALLDPAFLREREAVLRAAYARRKSVVGLARLLGAPLLLRLAASRVAPGLLSVAHAEAAVGRVLGVKTRAVVSHFAELGADVDKPEDLDAARRWAETEREKRAGPVV